MLTSSHHIPEKTRGTRRDCAKSAARRVSLFSGRVLLQLSGRFCAWGNVRPHVLHIHGSLARAFVRQISFWPQGTGVRLFPRPGKQEPGEGHTPGINRVRARLGAYTNPVRDLPAAGARACEAQGKKRQGARIARRSRACVRDTGKKKTRCATCSPQVRRCEGI